MLEYDKEEKLQLKLYDKRDDFNFPIVNFPFLWSNIPSSPAYGVHVSQLIRYARASNQYGSFLTKGVLLTNKLLTQGYLNLCLNFFEIFFTPLSFYMVFLTSLFYILHVTGVA